MVQLLLRYYECVMQQIFISGFTLNQVHITSYKNKTFIRYSSYSTCLTNFIRAEYFCHLSDANMGNKILHLKKNNS